MSLLTEYPGNCISLGRGAVMMELVLLSHSRWQCWTLCQGSWWSCCALALPLNSSAGTSAPQMVPREAASWCAAPNSATATSCQEEG